MKGKSFAFFLFTFALIALFLYGLYWLWQRQPKLKSQDTGQATVQTSQNPNPQKQQDLSPEDFSVLQNAKVTFKGITQPNGYVLVYSDSLNEITTADPNGNFQKDITLPVGFNLIAVSYVSPDLKKTGQKILTLNVNTSQNNNGDKIYAGTVKSIFDNLITLTTANGEKGEA